MAFAVIEIKKTKKTDIVFPLEVSRQDLVVDDTSYIRVPAAALPGEACLLIIISLTTSYLIEITNIEFNV